MGSCSLSRSARLSQTRKMPVEDDGLPAAAPAQPQGKAPASRPAVQAAAAQAPTDNPYKTPSASPASMRPRRQLAAKGRPTPEKHDAAVKMGPPPAPKRKPVQRTPTHRTRGEQQYQAAVAAKPLWEAPVRSECAPGMRDYPTLPAPGKAAGWQMPSSWDQRMNAAAAGACSTPSPSGACVSPATGPSVSAPGRVVWLHLGPGTIWLHWVAVRRFVVRSERMQHIISVWNGRHGLRGRVFGPGRRRCCVWRISTRSR